MLVTKTSFRIALLVSAMVAFSGGVARAQVIDTCSGDTIYCPIPQTFAGSPYIPEFADMQQQLSPNGRMLSIEEEEGDGGACVLDLQTLKRQEITFKGDLPDESDAGIYEVAWCPYDSDLLAAVVVSTIDTGDYVVQNIFTYRISTGVSQLITPKAAGPYGPRDIELYSWLPSSRPGSDSLSIFYSGFTGIYVPQTQALIAVQDTSTMTVVARGTGHIVYYQTVNGVYGPVMIDSNRIGFPYPNDGFDGPGSFSPDGNLFVLDVDPTCPGNGNLFPELWIYKVRDPSIPFSYINFQKLFCTYNFWGIYPVFITDSTIAVSMHKDLSDTSALYEITVDGRLVRQLTYVPQSSAEIADFPANSLSLISYPDPITSTTTISFTLPSASQVTLTLTDAAGRETPLFPAQYLSSGQHEVTWDASNYPSGVYLCRLEYGGQNATRRVVVIK